MSQPDLRTTAPSPVAGPGADFRAMAELMPQLVWSTTPDGYHDYFNARWYAYTGMPRPDDPGGEHETGQGWNWKEFLHPDDYDRAQAVWAHSLQTGESYEIEYRFRERTTGGYRWFLGRAEPLRDDAGRIVRWFGTCTDIDDAKQNELALGVLADAGSAAALAEDVDAALGALAQVAVPRLADWCAVDLADAVRPHGRRVAVAHVDPSKVALAHELAERYPPDPRDVEQGVPLVLRSARPVLMREVPDELLVAAARDADHLRLIRALGLCSAIIVPILADERAAGDGAASDGARVLGAISLVAAEARRRYTERDLAHAEELARRASHVVARLRLTAALRADRARLAEQAHELATQNEELQQQAVEMEMQAAQLQEQAAELEAQAEDLQVSNAALASSEARFRALWDSMAQGVVYLDGDGRITDANPAAERLLGLSLDQLTGRAPADPAWRAVDAAGGPLAPADFPSARAAVRGEVVRGARVGILNPALGEHRWLQVDAAPEVRPGEDRPFRAYALFDDVTDAVRHEETRARLADAERDARERMARLFEQAPVAISATRGPDHVFELANASYRRLLRGGEPIGRPAREVLAELGPAVADRLDHVYAAGETFVAVELPVRFDRDGAGPRDAYFNLIYEPLRDAGGAVTGILTVAHEVTDQVQARRAVERARESAEEANLAKSQFLRTVSHELRTPLNAIAGYADLVLMGLRGPVTDDQRGDLERIKRASQHLLGLINDILSFAKLEAGQMELEVRDVELRTTLLEVEALVTPQLAAKSLRFARGECPPGLRVRADEERVRQVLLNLLSNAVKFTDAGGRVAVDCEQGPTEVAVRVRDTGIGIPPEALERIFDPFVQVGRDLRAPSDGVGLGLAISRDLARRMGGELTAESRVGEGSVFTLMLPRGD
ncbi:ATP-binding protein [Roseisolibacter sp. H3M3-2]|uniref:ATP-binding protein n=1 Tax=Roseisolibacter sp. H3M3-2 TaxID=3031323 RepID=UPI0023DA07F6|nr:ATP-binding protein [Roseisolibacter sp. H3M3-2]MDF1504744.1 PAS domain-containing protein [Roseisolibacter sp. H3M3-2]